MIFLSNFHFLLKIICLNFLGTLSPNPIAMDVDKYAPFTSSPLDSSRGRGRRLARLRLRTTSFRSTKPEPTVVVIVSQTQSAEQTTVPQVGSSSNGKITSTTK